MSKLAFFKFDNLGTPRERAPLPERLLEGNPTLRNWDVDTTSDGKVSTGVFEVTPGTVRSIKGETWEFCYILSGISELTEDGKEPIRIQAGDAFVMQPGYLGKWRCVETTRKIWVVYN